MGKAHLVGSVNLADAETVFRSAAKELGPALPRIPDGETDRPFVTWMIGGLADNPGLDYEPNGLFGGLLPRVTIRPGFEDSLDLGPLGIADAAKRSFALFSELKREGAIRPETRYQMSIPSAVTVGGNITDLDQQDFMISAAERAITREIEAIVAAIPHDELAIQFDMPAEIGLVEGVFPSSWGTDMDPIAARAATIAKAVPEDVEMGIHLCYGDPPPAEGERGKHWLEPKDTSVLVELANRLAAAIDRRIDWFHFPVPIERDDAAYFKPLEGLRIADETQLFLGLVHDEDGIEGTTRRIEAARPFRASFGVGTECGMGRISADDIPGLLKLQAEAAAVAG